MEIRNKKISLNCAIIPKVITPFIVYQAYNPNLIKHWLHMRTPTYTHPYTYIQHARRLYELSRHHNSQIKIFTSPFLKKFTVFIRILIIRICVCVHVQKGLLHPSFCFNQRCTISVFLKLLLFLKPFFSHFCCC